MNHISWQRENMMQYVGSLSVCVGDEGGGEGSVIHPPLPESTLQRQIIHIFHLPIHILHYTK